MRLRLAFIALLTVFIWPASVHADTTAATPGLELSELFPDPASPLTDEHDEFTEVHNVSGDDLDSTGYSLKIGTHVFVFKNVVVPADGYTTVTSADSTLSLPNTGGTMQLLAPTGAIIDTTTYGAAKTGQSWAKIDSVWQWTNQVTQGDDNAASVIAAPSPNTAPAGGLGDGAPAATTPSPVVISELLPDPASPLTDAADEYIELYNPSSDAVDVTGFQLKTGKTLSSHYTLAGQIAPGGYNVYKSAQTHLQLANAGSSVGLFDASGAQVDTTVTYGTAITGAGWARFADGWSWTTTPTPGNDNVLTAIPVKVIATPKASSTAKTSASKTTAKTSAAKKLSTKAASAAKTVATKTTALATAAAKGSGLWLLFVLGGLTIGFVIYEFRYDVIDLYQRARSYWRRRGQAGS